MLLKTLLFIGLVNYISTTLPSVQTTYQMKIESALVKDEIADKYLIRIMKSPQLSSLDLTEDMAWEAYYNGDLTIKEIKAGVVYKAIKGGSIVEIFIID